MSEREKQISYTNTNMKNLEKCIDDLICKAEIEADIEKKCVDTKGEGGSRKN